MVRQPLLKATTILTALAALLALLATAVGLLVPDFYAALAAKPELLAGSLAQDASVFVVTLLMLWGLWWTWRDSARGLVLWAAGLAFLIYSYVIYAFGGLMTPLYPVYLAILSLAFFALASLLGGLSSTALRQRMDEGMPVRALAVVLCSVLLLVPMWGVQILEGIRVQVASDYSAIFVLDLGFVIPISVLASALLWQRRPWGVVLAGVMLAKFALMG